MHELLFNGYIRTIFFVVLLCILCRFAKWAFPNILATIRQRDRFLNGQSNQRGVFLLVIASISIGVMFYVLFDCWRYGDFIALEEKWPLFVLGVVGVLVFLWLFKDYFNVEQLKAQFPPIVEALAKLAEETRALQGKVEAFIPRLRAFGPYLEDRKHDYRWEIIEAEKETFDVCQAFYRCWNKYDPDESRDRQPGGYKSAVREERALAGRVGGELKKKIVEILDEYQRLSSYAFGQSSQLPNLPDSNDLRRLTDSNALELASLVNKIAVRLKSDQSKTILNSTTNDGMPWAVYVACLYGFSNASNVVPNYDVRLNAFIQPNGVIEKIWAQVAEVQRRVEELRQKANEIDNLIRSCNAEVQQTPSHWTGNYLYTLLKKQEASLEQQKKDLLQAKKDFEVLKNRVETFLTNVFRLVTELAFARLRVVGKRAERWALGFEETLELSQGLRDANLLDYERIFDVERGHEIQNKALASSNPILKKYATIIEHFEPDRFFNIELPFPMLSSERQNLEDAVPELAKSLIDGLKNWRTATFNLMKQICKENPDFIVARCTSHINYQPGESEMIVVIKRVVDRGNVKRTNGGRKFEYYMDHNPNSDDSDLELNVPRSTNSRGEELSELAYVALRLTITQNKLKRIAGFSGLYADPNSISRESQFYKPHDYKAGAQNGRYVCIGMTHGTSHGFSTGYSHGQSHGTSCGSSGGGSESWGTSESWSEGESEGESETEMWVADVNSDPNFSKLTKNELVILSQTVQDLMGSVLRDGDLGVNSDYNPDAEGPDAGKRKNRRRY